MQSALIRRCFKISAHFLIEFDAGYLGNLDTLEKLVEAMEIKCNKNANKTVQDNARESPHPFEPVCRRTCGYGSRLLSSVACFSGRVDHYLERFRFSHLATRWEKIRCILGPSIAPCNPLLVRLQVRSETS